MTAYFTPKLFAQAHGDLDVLEFVIVLGSIICENAPITLAWIFMKYC